MVSSDWAWKSAQYRFHRGGSARTSMGLLTAESPVFGSAHSMRRTPGDRKPRWVRRFGLPVGFPQTSSSFKWQRNLRPAATCEGAMQTARAGGPGTMRTSGERGSSLNWHVAIGSMNVLNSKVSSQNVWTRQPGPPPDLSPKTTTIFWPLFRKPKRTWRYSACDQGRVWPFGSQRGWMLQSPVVLTVQ